MASEQLETITKAAAELRRRLAEGPEQTKVDTNVYGVWLNSRYHHAIATEAMSALADMMEDMIMRVGSWSDLDWPHQTDIANLTKVAEAILVNNEANKEAN